MSIKMRGKSKKDSNIVTVKALINHPMETGQRKDKKTGEKIPAHFIQTVVVSANDKKVMEAFWGGSVSKNPYISFSYEGKKGDKLNLKWVDNKGKSDSTDVEVK